MTARKIKQLPAKKGALKAKISKALRSPKVIFVVVFALSGIAATTLLRASSLSPPAGDSEKMIGINGTYNSDTYVADARDMNAKWMRVESWGDNATYDTVPAALNRLSAQNIRMLPLINSYSTSWVSETGKQEWINKVVYAANTYAKGGTFWQGKVDLGSPVIEVGNEIYGWWYPWPDQGSSHPEEYAKMMDRAASAVATATNGKVKLIASATADYHNVLDKTGGSDGTWRSWAADMKAGAPALESKLGGIAVHPYGDIAALGIGTSTDPNFSHQVLYTVHSQWNLPIYETEVGLKVPVVSEQQQAAGYNYYFDELKNNPWLVGIFIYNQKDYAVYDPNGDNGWALIDYQDRRLPAWTIFQNRASEFLPQTVADTTAPTGVITTPTEGGTLSGVNNITATGSDSGGISGIQFTVDGNTLGTEDTAAPYGTSWDSRTVTNGSHTISAKIRDLAGNMGQARPVVVNVNNALTADNIAPSTPVGLVVIKKSSTTVSFSWTNSTDIGGAGVAGYRIYRNGVLIGNSSLPSYNDSALSPAKFYNYTVVAYDKAGNSSTPSGNLKIRTSKQ